MFHTAVFPLTSLRDRGCVHERSHKSYWSVPGVAAYRQSERVCERAQSGERRGFQTPQQRWREGDCRGKRECGRRRQQTVSGRVWETGIRADSLLFFLALHFFFRLFYHSATLCAQSLCPPLLPAASSVFPCGLYSSALHPNLLLSQSVLLFLTHGYLTVSFSFRRLSSPPCFFAPPSIFLSRFFF